MAKRLKDETAPPKDHNSAPNKGKFLAYLREATIKKTEAEEKQGEYRAILKRAKADGIEPKVIIAVMAAKKREPEDVERDMLREIEAMRWAGLPIGAQSDMFNSGDGDSHTTVTQDAAQLEFDANQNGYKAGQSGQEREDNPHPAGSELYVAWERGQKKGNDARAAVQKAGLTEVPAPKRGGGRKKAASAPEPAPEPEPVDEEHEEPGDEIDEEMPH